MSVEEIQETTEGIELHRNKALRSGNPVQHTMFGQLEKGPPLAVDVISGGNTRRWQREHTGLYSCNCSDIPE
jgi:hypothetical protein